MSGIAQLKRKRDKALASAARIQADIDAAKQRKSVRCNHCGKRSAIRLLTYIQTFYYIQPYGCTGGDYWSAGEGRFRCEKCGYENRLIYRPEIVALKRFFGRVEKRHGRDESAKWCN